MRTLAAMCAVMLTMGLWACGGTNTQEQPEYRERLQQMDEAVNFMGENEEVDPAELHRAAWRGDVERVRRVLEAGVDVDLKNARNETALHNASQAGEYETVQLLLDAGADVHAQDGIFGSTPLHKAAMLGHDDVVDALLRRGARLDVKNRDGYDPVGIARREGQSGTAERLEAHRAEQSPEE